MDKAHVEHAVGFVEHQHLHLAQVQHALLQQVEQASRGGHQNVHAFFQRADLRVHADAAKDDGGGQFEVLAVGFDRFFDLGGQLAGGRQHQGADGDAAELVLARRSLRPQVVQHGQHKGGGLAGAGLGAAQQVVACQHQREWPVPESAWGFRSPAQARL